MKIFKKAEVAKESPFQFIFTQFSPFKITTSQDSQSSSEVRQLS